MDRDLATGPASTCSEGRFNAALNMTVGLLRAVDDPARVRVVGTSVISQGLMAEVLHILEVVQRVADIATETGESFDAAWDRLERTGDPPARG